MNKFILGKKIEMSQIFLDNGKVAPVTLIEAGPVEVKRIRTKEHDGYEAVQIAFGKHMREFKPETISVKTGDTIDVSLFKEGEKVEVSGISKGKGFQGVVKRHNFGGASKTHGTKHAHRQPGSISGGGRAGGRVSKGLRMAGRMGSDRVTIKNLEIIKIIPEQNVIAIKGAIPGNRGSLVEVRAK